MSFPSLPTSPAHETSPQHGSYPRQAEDTRAEHDHTYEVLSLSEAIAQTRPASPETLPSTSRSARADTFVKASDRATQEAARPASPPLAQVQGSRALPGPNTFDAYFAGPVGPLKLPPIAPPVPPFAGPVSYDNLSASGFEPFADVNLRKERLEQQRSSSRRATPQQARWPSFGYLSSVALQVGTTALGVRALGVAVTTLRFGLAGMFPEALGAAACGVAAGYGLVFAVGAAAFYLEVQGLIFAAQHLRRQWHAARGPGGFAAAHHLHQDWQRASALWPIAQATGPNPGVATLLAANMALGALALGQAVPVLGLALTQANLLAVDAYQTARQRP